MGVRRRAVRRDGGLDSTPWWKPPTPSQGGQEPTIRCRRLWAYYQIRAAGRDDAFRGPLSDERRSRLYRVVSMYLMWKGRTSELDSV
jgi:hypothetical protein